LPYNRKKYGKTSVRAAMHKHAIRIHSHNNKNTQITLLNRGKGKGKLHPGTGHEGPEGE